MRPVNTAPLFLAIVLGVASDRPAYAQCQAAVFRASDGSEADHFGLNLSFDGRTAFCGAMADGVEPDAGAVYVHPRPPIGVSVPLVEHEKLTAHDGADRDWFLRPAVSGDFLLIGAHRDDDAGLDSGSAYIFEREGRAWVERVKLKPADHERFDAFGGAVALQGNVAVIGSFGDDVFGTDSGSAYVFERQGKDWIETFKLVPDDGTASADFGSSVAIDGDVIVVGADRDDDLARDAGSAYVFEREDSGWVQQAKLLDPAGDIGDLFGCTVAVKGSFIMVGAPYRDEVSNNEGVVLVFKREAEDWVLHTRIVPQPAVIFAQFGRGLSMHGDWAAIGAPANQGGSVFLYRLVDDAWVRMKRLRVQERSGRFGTAVALHGDYLVAGAPNADFGVGLWSGAAYLFRIAAEGDQGLSDYAAMQACFTGAGGGGLSDCCALFDYDLDDDVDGDDFDAFMARFTGP